METVPWNKAYETGVEDIDLQHHYFLNLINHIIEAIGENKEKSHIEALVYELDAYAKFHFTSEERMMVHSHYPEYETHKSHHIELIQRLSIEQYKLINMKDKDSAEAVIAFLLNWFSDHTTGEDKLFATYLFAKHDEDDHA